MYSIRYICLLLRTSLNIDVYNKKKNEISKAHDIGMVVSIVVITIMNIVYGNLSIFFFRYGYTIISSPLQLIKGGREVVLFISSSLPHEIMGVVFAFFYFVFSLAVVRVVRGKV